MLSSFHKLLSLLMLNLKGGLMGPNGILCEVQPNYKNFKYFFYCVLMGNYFFAFATTV
ncbi:hypothetical protein SAMN05660816_03675 [Niastella yeongjuensis]|nr:hypothetical protein SAMN05660816_03675 [Niastella yeongjuensis]